MNLFLTFLQLCFPRFSRVSNLSERPGGVILMGGPPPIEEVVIQQQLIPHLHAEVNPSDVSTCCAFQCAFPAPLSVANKWATKVDVSFCRHVHKDTATLMRRDTATQSDKRLIKFILFSLVHVAEQYLACSSGSSPLCSSHKPLRFLLYT